MIWEVKGDSSLGLNPLSPAPSPSCKHSELVRDPIIEMESPPKKSLKMKISI